MPFIAYRRGSTVVFVSLSLFVLLGAAAFAVDWGLITFTKHQLQNFVDAAALAGAQELPDANNARQKATENYARNYANNFNLASPPTPQPISCTDPISSATVCYRIGTDEVQVTTPYAPSGDPTPSPNRIHVRACRRVNLFFARLLGMASRRVCAEAAARKGGARFPRGLVVLDGSGSHALFLQGNARFTVINGSIIVDSNAPDAIFAQGSATLNASEILVTGNFRTQGNALITPTPQTGQPPVPDPLANLPPPSTTGLPVFPGRTIHGDATLYPGVYTGLVKLQGNSFVTMQPGTYIFQGGLLVSGNSQLMGNGVMLYVEGGRIEVQGNGQMRLTPPTSGTYAGITIFYARTNSNPLWLSGNAVQNLQGTVYLPRSLLHLQGNANLTQGMIVTWRAEIIGNPTVTIQAQEPPAATGGDTGSALEG
ncbi:MAG: hypothetical protein HZLCBSQH_001893 [Candidatus Fervidibacterota bacterium]